MWSQNQDGFNLILVSWGWMRRRRKLREQRVCFAVVRDFVLDESLENDV